MVVIVVSPVISACIEHVRMPARPRPLSIQTFEAVGAQIERHAGGGEATVGVELDLDVGDAIDVEQVDARVGGQRIRRAPGRYAARRRPAPGRR
ncbi:MAG: hypothetical protein U0168_13295 [Nannocystaceae bacterium]